MIEKDPFTNVNDLNDYDQYAEWDESVLSELAKNLGLLNPAELAEKIDNLVTDDDFDNGNDITCCDNNDFYAISEYFEHTVLPYEKDVRIAEIINKLSNQEVLVPKSADLSKMKNYDNAPLSRKKPN